MNYIRDLLPWIRNTVGWTRVNLTVKGQQTHVQYLDRSNRTYSVTIESLNRFILFSIVENDRDISTAPGEDVRHPSGASTIGS